jgi:hypothetical protein
VRNRNAVRVLRRQFIGDFPGSIRAVVIDNQQF